MNTGVSQIWDPYIFTEPARCEDSEWITHVPFAFHLMNVLRPTRLLELGTQRGVSYCSFCQAATDLKLTPFQAWAVDSWKGDKHTGDYGDSVFANLQAYHDPKYNRFSTLLRMDFDAALDVVQGDLDVIHIDGLHTYEAVKHDFETWLPRLKEKGVMLFHDTREYSADFGVHKFWAELAEKFPHFEFHHGHGLGVLAPRGCPESMRALFELTTSGANHVRLVFEAAGGRAKQSCESRIAMNALQQQLNEIRDSESYRLGRFLLSPIRLMRLLARQ